MEGNRLPLCFVLLLWRNEIVANLYLFCYGEVYNIFPFGIRLSVTWSKNLSFIFVSDVLDIEVLEVMLTSLLLVTSLTGTLKCEFDLIT